MQIAPCIPPSNVQVIGCNLFRDAKMVAATQATTEMFGYSPPEVSSLPNRDTLRWIQGLDLPVALRNPRRSVCCLRLVGRDKVRLQVYKRTLNKFPQRHALQGRSEWSTGGRHLMPILSRKPGMLSCL